MNKDRAKTGFARDSQLPSFQDYLAIARFDHWFKNVFVLPGVAVAIGVGADFTWQSAEALILALIATGFIASANYTINEYLDAEFDRFHPSSPHAPLLRV